MSLGPYEIVPVVGNVVFSTVTHTTKATADTVATTTTDHAMIVIANNLNQDCMLTYNALDWLVLPAGVSMFLDLSPNQRALRSGKIVGIYHLGVAPTTGRIGVTLL